MAEKLKIIALGGLNEIGKNMTVLEYGKDIIIVDCGLGFPEDDMYGVDLVIADMTYLVKNQNRIRGMFLTHGHEDHIGALPWMISQYKGMLSTPLPIYGSPFTLALVEHKLAEHGLLDRVELCPVAPRERIRLGNLEFFFSPVCHSSPPGYALLVDTPVGKVVHTGDFKLDDEPLGEASTLCEDIAAFAGD